MNMEKLCPEAGSEILLNQFRTQRLILPRAVGVSSKQLPSRYLPFMKVSFPVPIVGLLFHIEGGRLHCGLLEARSFEGDRRRTYVKNV